MAQIVYTWNPLAPPNAQPTPALGPLTGRCISRAGASDRHRFRFLVAIPAHLARAGGEGLYRCERCQLTVRSHKWPAPYQLPSLQVGCPVNSTGFHTWHRHAWDFDHSITCSGCRRVHAKCAHARWLPLDDARSFSCLDCSHVIYNLPEVVLTSDRFWLP